MEAVNEEFWYATVDIPVLRDKSVAAMTRFIFTIVCTFAWVTISGAGDYRVKRGVTKGGFTQRYTLL